jgi:hypothetical protein
MASLTGPWDRSVPEPEKNDTYKRAVSIKRERERERERAKTVPGWLYGRTFRNNSPLFSVPCFMAKV